MRKTLFLYSSLFIIYSIISIQQTSAQYYGYPERNLSFGLSTNPNIGWLTFDNSAYDQEAKIGYSYGLIADFGFTRNYFFSTGLQINTLNTRLIVDNNENTQDLRLQYAEIPLAIKLKTDGNNLGRFYGQFGFTTGVKVSGKSKELDSSNFSKMNRVNLLRLGLQIGAGAEWRVGGSLSFLTGLTYNNGFTQAVKTGQPKNSYLSLNAGVLF